MGAEPERWTAAQLRGLAHPLRLELLHVLRAEGPATATQLARRLGESSGSTSYHLRALHRAGMVEEAERRNGRERWWQRTGSITMPNSIPLDAPERERSELQAAHAQVESILVERDERALASWMAVRYDLPLEWQDSQWIGNLRLWGTADEVRQFVTTVLDLSEPLRNAPESPDSDRREVHFTFRVLPQGPET